jgi:hypothetical protein
MTNVTQFPSKPDPVDEIKGPSRYGNVIVIDGHEVPNMWIVDKGETVELCFPGPVHYIFPRDIAAHACALAAKAMAIGAGHSHVSSEHAMTKPYGPKVSVIKPT